MLPKIDLPTYELKLPSSGKSVTVRPFLVKEEKLLLMALESGETQDVINTTHQIINNCILSGDIKVSSLPFFDVDYLFIALRAKSIGESIDIKFTCNNVVDDHVCGATFPAKIDISNCKVIKDENISSDIQLTGDLKIKMKYPTYSVMKSIFNNENALNKKIRIMASCVEYIVEKDQIHSSKDISKEEIIEFIENLPQEQFKKLEAFIDNFPHFLIASKATCEKCGFEHDLEYSDFTSFFV